MPNGKGALAMPQPRHRSVPIADAPADNWVDRYAPEAWLPYLKLARFDRPIGAWLLLFPCWWSLALAELARGSAYPDPWYVIMFLIGAFVMRGAGCTWNDIVDRDYDGRVERTARRPIPSGQVTVLQAFAFAVGLSLVGLIVLLQFNTFTIWVGIASLALVAVYPLAKRYTYWPQFVLGLTFKWGALVGWASIFGTLHWPALVLYAGCVLWTIGYDTIYAHQDKEDDALLGLKSTALRFGPQTQKWLTAFYAGAVILWAVAAALAGAHMIFFLALALAGAQLAWQVATLQISDASNCLTRFRSNREVGWILFLGLVADMAISAGASKL